MVSADPSEVGRIDIRFGLRPPLRSASDLKSDPVEALRRQGMAGLPSAFLRERRSGHKKPRNSAGLDDSMPDPTSLRWWWLWVDSESAIRYLFPNDLLHVGFCSYRRSYRQKNHGLSAIDFLAIIALKPPP